MCKVCKNIKNYEIADALKEIEIAIKEGKKPEHFDKILDELLGTKEIEEDVELNEAWEQNRLTKERGSGNYKE